MKYLLPLLVTILFTACENKPGTVYKPWSQDSESGGVSIAQKSLYSLISQYQMKYSAAANEMSRDEIRKQYLDSAHRFITDSLKGQLKNCRVYVKEIKAVDWRGGKAFIAEFTDSETPVIPYQNRNEYWMEMDFENDKVDSMYSNPVYKLLKDIPEGTDTTLSFFYLGEVEWKDRVLDGFKMQIVPFPQDFNFDSAQAANKSKKVGKVKN